MTYDDFYNSFKHIEIKYCPECGGKIENICEGEYRCFRCHKHIYDNYGLVKKYIEENGKTSISNIAKSTGVPMQTVYCLVDHYKKSTKNQDAMCPACGNKIQLGQKCTFCEKQRLKERTEKLKAFRYAMSKQPNINDETLGIIYNSHIDPQDIAAFEKLEKMSKNTNSKLVRDLYQKKKTELKNKASLKIG